MRVLIDTLHKTLTLQGSFHYEEFAAFYLTLPKEWRNFTFLVPVESLDTVMTGIIEEPKQIEQKEYPVALYRNEDPRDCGCGIAADRSCDC